MIREARPTDIAWFQPFSTPSAPDWIAEVEQWVRDDAWYWFRKPGHRRTLYVDDIDGGEVVAIAGIEEAQSGAWYVAAICVRDDARHEGRGRAFLDWLIGELLGDESTSMFWLVDERNEASHRLSESVGAWRSPVARGNLVEYVLPNDDA